MLRLDQLKLSPGESERLLRKKAAKLLRVPEGEILSLRVLRRAVDARAPLQLVYAVAVEVRQEKQILRRCRDKRVSVWEERAYHPPLPLAARTLPPSGRAARSTRSRTSSSARAARALFPTASSTPGRATCATAGFCGS